MQYEGLKETKGVYEKKGNVNSERHDGRRKVSHETEREMEDEVRKRKTRNREK